MEEDFSMLQMPTLQRQLTSTQDAAEDEVSADVESLLLQPPTLKRQLTSSFDIGYTMDDNDINTTTASKRLKVDETATNSTTTTNSVPSSNHVKCPYLDTVNRSVLDFDQLKICSVTMMNMNIYACLVCGKFFEGRGKSTAAFTHSVEHSHFVFMNVSDGRSYCLPDGYEVVDPSLNNIRKCLCPKYSDADVSALDSNVLLAKDIHGNSYLPGFIGLNNLKSMQYVNVVLHALSHVKPLRNYFLTKSTTVSITSGGISTAATASTQLAHMFSSIISKMWSKDNFKSVISPVEFLELVHGRFSLTTHRGCNDITEFLVWLLNDLHQATSSDKNKSSIIYDTFQGQIEVVTRRRRDGTSTNSNTDDDSNWIEERKLNPFTYLPLTLPPMSLFQSTGAATAVIPQVPLQEVLKRYDGITWSDHIDSITGLFTRKQYRITRYPEYLILHLVRHTKTNFNQEKNNTLVSFPIKNLEVKSATTAAAYAAGFNDLSLKTVAEIKELVRSVGNQKMQTQLDSIVDRHELQALGAEALAQVSPNLTSKYDLVANICYTSSSNDSSSSSNSSSHYKVHLQNQAANQWYEIQGNYTLPYHQHLLHFHYCYT